MCPGYFKIKAGKEASVGQLIAWIGKELLKGPIEVSQLEAYNESTENGNWLGRSFIVSQQGQWTVFEDITGFIYSEGTDAWSRLAKEYDLVVAGYNDSILLGRLIIIEEGKVVREFFEHEKDRSDDVNEGPSPYEDDSPIGQWSDLEEFVYDETYGYEVNEGTLYVFKDDS
ncbi:MAG: hypothetical protein AAFX93_13215 [Verrucomicrobiota bacterium]